MARLKISTRLMIMMCLLVLLQAALLGGFALRYLSSSLEDQIGLRALQLASMIAQTPAVREAARTRDSHSMQMLAEELREATDATFISIGDSEGIRLAHPLPERIGKPMVGGDNERALKLGQSYISRATGSLGPSVRGKAPIFSEQGDILGVVSVGYLTTSLEHIILRYQSIVISVTLGLLLLSILLAVWISRRFRAAIYGLEPHQIARLFEERNATLESVREGIIAVNAEGQITTFNQAAAKTLGLPAAEPIRGRPIQEVLPDSRLPDLLQSGQPEFDRELAVEGQTLIVNRIPIRDGDRIIGGVASFRRKDELDQVSRQLTQIRQYAETLRSQAHEYANKLHTIAGLIQIGASDRALEIIGQETREHQALLRWLSESVGEPVLSGCLLGKYNRAHELGLQLEIDPDSHMGALPEGITPEQIVTLLGNLLDNAFEATLAAGGRQVRLSMTDLGRELIFEIEDEGAGVPMAEREKIFQRGHSSKSTGRGIGLHLVRQTLTQLGGEITVSDGSNGGARFTAYIPKEVEAG
ncbi:histidine kinase [Marinobacterium nitratireducens]|uniref:histidine kinase n=1 Tax=Marinobacterium nitratireducens TaxID=518897 RepID=A0A917ZFB4_9GAMM|nr:sensor histidine kinase [Marinobacterium nitratireducens]GGO81996.1 histidine kinase [Marinobacterium nitratireducens]